MSKYEDCIKLAKEKYENDFLDLDKAVKEAIEFYYTTEELCDLYRMFHMTENDLVEHLKGHVLQ